MWKLVRLSLRVSGPAGCLCLKGCRIDWLRLSDLPAVQALIEERAWDPCFWNCAMALDSEAV